MPLISRIGLVHGDFYQKVWFIFYCSLSIFFKDRNKEYLLTKVKQFYKFGFGENYSQFLAISSHIHN